MAGNSDEIEGGWALRKSRIGASGGCLAGQEAKRIRCKGLENWRNSLMSQMSLARAQIGKGVLTLSLLNSQFPSFFSCDAQATFATNRETANLERQRVRVVLRSQATNATSAPIGA
jgi:hypothetical protein